MFTDNVFVKANVWFFAAAISQIAVLASASLYGDTRFGDLVSMRREAGDRLKF
jgi:hypothetical protein